MDEKYIESEEFTGYKSRTNTLSTNAKLDSKISVKSEYTGVVTVEKFNDLANAIYQLESEFSNNCCQSVNLNCCQTCQGCQRCQTCQSCQFYF